MRTRLMLLGGLALGAALAAPAAPPPVPEARPMLGLPTAGLDVARVPAGSYVFATSSHWTQFWGRYSRAPAPLVDFARWQVAAVFLGRRPNPGYGVTVLDSTTREGRATVRYQEWTPAPGSVWAQTVTYPVDIVAIPAGAAVGFCPTTGPRPAASPVPRELRYAQVDVSGLSPAVPEQFLAFSDAAGWQQFWRRNAPGSPPTVDFAKGWMVVGVAGFRTRSGVTLSRVTRAGDIVTVVLGPGGPACEAGVTQTSLLLIVPQVPRVNYALLPFCR